MPVIAAVKTLLLVLLLLVIPASMGWAAPNQQNYRFGNWLLVLPAEFGLAAPQTGRTALMEPGEDLDLIAYWLDGRERALALHMNSADSNEDHADVKTHGDSYRIEKCDFGRSARIRPLKQARSAAADAAELPEDFQLQFPDGRRSVQRVGDLLVADLSTARIQIMQDSPVVRVGEWSSGDSCRFELQADD